MKEIKSIIKKYDTLKSSGSKMALANVINVELSSYRRSGARMLIMEDGTWIGGISGGCLEGDTLQKAQYAMLKNESTTVRYDTREDDPNQIGVGLGCNGLIEVLITPIDNLDPQNPIEILRQCATSRKEHIIIHIVKSNADPSNTGRSFHYVSIENAHFYFDLKISKKLAEYIDQARKNKQSYLREINGNLIFIEFLPPVIQLLIYGSNYDVIPLLKIADQVGWDTHVVTLISKISMEIKEFSHHLISSKSTSIPMDEYSAVLLMSHDYKTDKNNFINLMDYKIPYVGLLGPKNRYEKLKKSVCEINDNFDFSNVYGPMGLDTGASTPEEIAISIIAEIRTVFSEREGGMLRNRKEPIYKS